MVLRVVTPPAAAIVAVATLKADLGLTGSDADAELATQIAAAQTAAEHYTQRRFVAQTVEWTPGSLTFDLPLAPVVPDSIVVRYVPSGASGLVTLSRNLYLVRQSGDWTQVRLRTTTVPPFIETEVDEPIVVTFEVGTAVDAVDQTIVSAVRRHARTLFERQRINPTLKKEVIEGIGSREFFDADAAGVDRATDLFRAALLPFVWAS